MTVKLAVVENDSRHILPTVHNIYLSNTLFRFVSHEMPGRRRSSSLDGTLLRKRRAIARRRQPQHDAQHAQDDNDPEENQIGPLQQNLQVDVPENDPAPNDHDNAAEVAPENAAAPNGYNNAAEDAPRQQEVDAQQEGVQLQDHTYAGPHRRQLPRGRRRQNVPAQQMFIGRRFPPEVDLFSVGLMDKTCTFCHALRFKDEPSNCCHKGKIVLPPSPPYPPELKDLFTKNDAPSKNFREHIRQFNSAMAFASFGAQAASPPGRGPYTFRLHGQIYHRTGSLHPADGTPPSYSQLYIIEGDQAVEERMRFRENQPCRRDVMAMLTTILDRINPYAAAYKQMQQVEQAQMQAAADNNDVPSTVTMYFRRGNDQRRYNDPRNDEVAAIFVSNDGAPPIDRDIVVHPKNEPPRQISYMSANIDPMVYPIFFPYGEYGWQHGMQHDPDHRTAKRTKVTLLQFYAHRLAFRDTFSPIFHGGKLFQQYVVDAYVRTEAARLHFIRMKQQEFRVELYQGLMDHINSRAEQQQLTPGKIVVLPSSFQGSPRAMQQSFQDAMAIVSKFGRPDLFLTFTCNPRWKDIVDALSAGQRAEHRPDIVARVFKKYLDELIKDIREGHVLGVPIAFVFVIEFQKRGLPHCHLLIILDDASKLRIPADIDSVICAEIPDPAAQPELHEIVKTSMVHGPCGALNKRSPCMSEDKCTKDYPKEFHEDTSMAVNGYPHYRRRDNGRTIKVGLHEVDNTWIVPYNPYLTKKFKAHINLEACTSIKSVKYLFKYVYKGYDCANVEVSEKSELNHDEVSAFVDARYVSAPEAYWRLSEYNMHKQSHAIVRLPVHLPRQQPVYFTEGNHQAAVEAAAEGDTMLTSYFKVNAAEPTEYCYSEFPNHFVYDTSRKRWKPRKRGGDSIIPRLYSVSPRDSERYCLRLLLHHVPGATCYEDIRRVEGETVHTFKEACILRHLLSDDREWHHALQEASHFQMPAQLRSLFATICLHCEPTNAMQLWEDHKEAMTEDIIHSQQISVQAAEQQALRDIDAILGQSGMSCSDFGLPNIEEAIPIDLADEYDIAREEIQANLQMAKLNADQRNMVDLIMGDLDEIRNGQDPKCRAYFLDGPGGSGKTMVYNTLIAYFRSQVVHVAPSAWTGIAGTLLTGGRTCHSLFKLPVPILDTSVCHVSPTSTHATYLRSITMFIIDEASMVPVHALSAIDNMLRDISGQDVPFGGKIFLLGGDFRQVLPVVPRKPRTVIVENCIKSSPLWSQFKVVKLTKNMRAGQDEQEFAKWVLAVGNGELELPADEAVPGSIQIPIACNIVHGDIVDDVFPDVTDSRAIANTVILTPTNENLLMLNDAVMKKMPGYSKQYLSADKAICDDEQEAQNYPIEFLNSLTPSGMPPHRLILKSGAIIMLLRNLDLKKGLCNGTRLILHRLHEHVLDAEILTGAFKGDRVLIPRIKLAPSDINLPFTLERIQFPIRLSYSMTINKAQGQTFDKVGVYLLSPVFSHGQLYVAFSRARSFDTIFVKVCQTTTQGQFGGKTITQNVVFKEIL
jgi:hypothetical protein